MITYQKIIGSGSFYPINGDIFLTRFDTKMQASSPVSVISVCYSLCI